MNFKKYFNITDKEPDFLDIPIDADLEVFIDPFLIANNKNDKLIDEIYNQVKAFFVKLNKQYIVTNDRLNGLLFLDYLHEPNEYHLGYSASNKGAAISNIRAREIFDALRNNRFARRGISVTNEAHNVLLLVTGIGQDIMSDTIANVCRDIFAKFTHEQCIKYGIATQKFSRHFFNPISQNWETVSFDLPSYLGKPIILLPRKIISSPRYYGNSYNQFIAGNYIAKDMLAGKIAVASDGRYIHTLKDGTRKAVIKRIVEHYGKPKDDLIDFVLEYGGSLDKFLDYVKERYPGIDFSDLE